VKTKIERLTEALEKFSDSFERFYQEYPLLVSREAETVLPATTTQALEG
jgi:hypothetical protein